MLWEELLWAVVFCEDIVVWPNRFANIFEARVTHKSANSISFVIVIHLLVNILVFDS